MTRWYAAALDLVVEFEFAIEAVGLTGVMLRSADDSADASADDPADVYRIELLHRPDAVAGIQASSPVDAALTLGFSHLALDVPDVDAVHAALLGAGASDRMSPRPSPEPGVRVAFVADPEGNLIELLDRTRT
ncbi:VOC family protein [Nocardioides sp. YIM 123512]|uniref:VOC family protein n=2 Tax=Nocardioides flavescens TaxID=2691959 RepID=A0A6L7F0H4_9ACTN|nr:VOC family protein [Nocardioides flavescens]